MSKISLELIQQLRGKTGIGMMECKKALAETKGDVDEAVKYLRKKGASVAAKRAGNQTSEGIVHTYIHPGSRVGVMVELNCETDFVARTQDMQDFAKDVGMHIAAMRPRYLSDEEADQAWIDQEKEIMRSQLVAAGKPAAMVDKILEGKIKKVLADVCLLKQPFVKNDKIKIEDLLKELIARLGEYIKIRRFARFEIGL